MVLSPFLFFIFYDALSLGFHPKRQFWYDVWEIETRPKALTQLTGYKTNIWFDTSLSTEKSIDNLMVELSNGSDHPFWPVTRYAKRLKWVNTTQLL